MAESCINEPRLCTLFAFLTSETFWVLLLLEYGENIQRRQDVF